MLSTVLAVAHAVASETSPKNYWRFKTPILSLSAYGTLLAVIIDSACVAAPPALRSRSMMRSFREVPLSSLHLGLRRASRKLRII